MAEQAAARPVRRQIDVFSAGCRTCNRAIELIAKIAVTEGHELRIHDMHEESVARRAEELGIRSIPAVAVVAPGQEAKAGQFAPLNATRLAACCADRGVDEAAIRETLARS
jgi:glutaredoxin 3